MSGGAGYCWTICSPDLIDSSQYMHNARSRNFVRNLTLFVIFLMNSLLILDDDFLDKENKKAKGGKKNVRCNYEARSYFFLCPDTTQRREM